MLQDYTSKGIKELAKETKTTKRLFRIDHEIYLFQGKFYKSDVFNIAYVKERVKPSIKHVNNVDKLYSVFEITDTERLKNIFNVR